MNGVWHYAPNVAVLILRLLIGASRLHAQSIHLELDHDGEDTLQTQIRKSLLAAIDAGAVSPELPLPSCRKLADQLDVSRNTIAIVYQGLVDDGYLTSRPKAGYFLSEGISTLASPSLPLNGHDEGASEHAQVAAVDADRWRARLTRRPSTYSQIRKPQNWQRFDYPFIYGQYDTGIFPLSSWRETVRRLLRANSDRDWLNDQVDRDDPLLVEQLRRRVLPRRGIFAESDEVLVTLGSQNGLYLISELLCGSGVRFGIEDPCYRDAYNILKWNGAEAVRHGIDQKGIIVGNQTAECDLLYVTPSHQVPTGIRMARDRRARLLEHARKHDQILIEDDYDADFTVDVDAPPALKATDNERRIIYLGSFSKALSPGLRLGYVVADRALIAEMRAMRRLMYRHPPTGLQRQVGEFLSLGHYDVLVRQLLDEATARRRTLRSSLEAYAGLLRVLNSPEASAFWCELPRGLESNRIVADATLESVLVEAGDSHYIHDAPPARYLRLGYTAIRRSAIEPGVRRLTAVIERFC